MLRHGSAQSHQNMKEKISIRFFNDREVRAVWNDTGSRWWFSVLDIVGVLNDQDNYEKNRNYWKYLKARLKKADVQLGSATNQLKLVASDGKKYLTDVIDSDGVVTLAKNFPNTKANRFIEWFLYSEETIDGLAITHSLSFQRTTRSGQEGWVFGASLEQPGRDAAV